MWTQDGRVSSQVLKVIHDHSHKQIEHLHKKGQWQIEKVAEIHRQAHMPLVCSCPDQEGAEEDEGDEVAVGEVGATASFVVWRHGERGNGGIGLTFLT